MKAKISIVWINVENTSLQFDDSLSSALACFHWRKAVSLNFKADQNFLKTCCCVSICAVHYVYDN